MTFEGVRMRLLTKRGRSMDFGRGPVLALYVDPMVFRKYFEEGRITNLILVIIYLTKQRFSSKI